MLQAQSPAPSAQQKSALNFVADALWEDFVAGRPIDGGVAFEAQLRHCRLDGSLGSLQRLDKFLLYIRSKITVPAQVFMMDDKNRNLIWFIGFYVGNVLAKIWKSTPNWLGRHDITSRYSHLDINSNNPFQQVALDYLPKSKHTTAQYKHLFFSLEPIANVVFADPAKPMRSVLGNTVESSLFDAVVARMPEQMRQKVVAMHAKKVAKKTAKNKATPQHKPTVKQDATGKNIAQIPNTPDVSHKPEASATATSQSSTSSPLSSPSSSQAVSKAPATALSSDPETRRKERQLLIAAKQAVTNDESPRVIRQDDFTLLRAELEDIDAPLTQGDVGVNDYTKASMVLDKFDNHIAKTVQAGSSVDSVTFSPTQKKRRMQALTLLNQSAQAGNTSAMLKLAIHYFLGEGVAQDEAKGFAWVQRAATSNDIRAQRQLSRLYYQGLGHEQNIEQGRYWLEKAADNGHQEAKTLLAHWNATKTIMDEQRFEQRLDQRYMLLGVVLVIVVIMVLILL